MTTISDVFAFAAASPDYWAEFLSGGDYPPELSDDETKALTAARAHIEQVTVELLHAAGAAFAERAPGLKRPRFQPGATKQNRVVRLPPPAKLGAKLYRVEFSLAANDANTAVELFGWLVVKKGALDALREALDKQSIAYAVDGYLLYDQGLPLVKGADIADLAKRAAEQAITLLKGFGSPPA